MAQNFCPRRVLEQWSHGRTFRTGSQNGRNFASAISRDTPRWYSAIHETNISGIYTAPLDLFIRARQKSEDAQKMEARNSSKD